MTVICTGPNGARIVRTTDTHPGTDSRFTGYAVLSASGNLMKAFPTRDEAIKHLCEVCKCTEADLNCTA